MRFFYLRQHFKTLVWQVVTISQQEAAAMRASDTGHVFDDARAAHAECDRLNRERDEA